MHVLSLSHFLITHHKTKIQLQCDGLQVWLFFSCDVSSEAEKKFVFAYRQISSKEKEKKKVLFCLFFVVSS